MNLSIRMNNVLRIYVVGMPIVYCISLLFASIGDSLNPMLIGFITCYIVTVIYAIKEYSCISLYAIFLYTSLFFVYTKLFLQVIFPEYEYDILEYTYPTMVKFSNDDGLIFVTAAFLGTYVMHVIYCLTNNSGEILDDEKKQNFNYIKFGIYIMLFFFIPVLTKTIIDVRYVMTNGYASLFLGYREVIEYPIWVNGAKAFFTAGYCLFLAGNPERKQFLKVSLLYGGVMVLGSLIGQRAGLISFLLITVYWYTKKYNVKVKARNFVSFGLALMVIIVFLNLLRNSYGTNDAILDLEFQLFLTKLIDQSGSSVVPLYVIHGNLDYHDFPFIFSPLFAFVNFLLYKNSQSVLSVQQTNDISDVITYNANPSLYLNGGGVGGSILGEMYDCGGYLGIIFWSAILAYIIKQFDCKQLNVNSKYVPLLYVFLLSIPMMPRSRFFGFTSFTLTLISVYIVMLILNVMVTKRK